MVLGLTGGIASGKSSVSRIFSKLGASIIDADLIAREITNDEGVLADICEEFGQEAVKNNSLDRKYIADIIFTNPDKRASLNAIVHPAVLSKIRTEIKNTAGFIVVDVPLLYEVKFEDEMEKIAVVYIDRNTQIKRLMARDQISEDQALARIDSQMSLEEKAERADIVIDNQGTYLELEVKVKELFEKLNR